MREQGLHVVEQRVGDEHLLDQRLRGEQIGGPRDRRQLAQHVAPRIAGEAPAAQAGDPNAPKLLLTVAIAKRGFYIAGAGGVLGGPADLPAVDATQPPTIPLRADGQYDYDQLTALLAKVKERYPKETNLILSADAEVPYDVLIKTMDAARESRVKRRDGAVERHPLFFDVSLSLVG